MDATRDIEQLLAQANTVTGGPITGRNRAASPDVHILVHPGGKHERWMALCGGIPWRFAREPEDSIIQRNDRQPTCADCVEIWTRRTRNYW